MKFNFTYFPALLFSLALPICATAQGISSLGNQKGYEASQNSGMLHTLSRWQQFVPRAKHASAITPQDRLLQQLGIREKSQYTTTAESYEFYGGESYKGNNVPMASITDADGNTYTTGGSTNVNQPSGDFFTIKTSPTGVILWEARKPAAIYAVEYGMHLLLDNDGNLVVTGISWNGNDMDIQTIKYDSDGDQLWSNTYNSTFEGVDSPAAIVAGSDNSIYITGLSWSGSSVDYITLKYNADGTLAWQARHNGPGGESWNEATALTLDPSGNVIVTGYSPNEDGWLNYHTVKYNNSGTEQWVQDYNYPSTDPANPSDVTNSIPRAVTTDANGNIYVTGIFDTFLGRVGTIKYNAAGQQQWTATYKSEDEKTQAYKIALRDDVLYVAGSHNGGFADDGNVLIAYTTDGDENWVQESTDLIDATNVQLLFDTDGNPVVAAKGMTPGAEEWQQDVAARAKKYSPAGSLLGQAAFVISTTEGTASMGDMAGTGLDADGEVYFSVNSFYSAEGAVFETVKSAFGTTSPATDWNTVYTNLGSPAASMLNSFPDGNGNTISTGSYYNFADGALLANYFVVKHTTEGNVAWQAVYNAESGDIANGIIGTADADGNVYVCLLPDSFEQPLALTIKKLSPQGTELWEIQETLYSPQLYVMQAGHDGSLYLGGVAYENEDANHASFTAIKLSATGTEEWKTFLSGPVDSDNIYGVSAGTLTPQGDFILTGTNGSGSFMSQETDLTVVKFNNDGTEGWVTPVPVASGSSSGTDLLVANDGSIYTNGFVVDSDTNMEDIVTAKLSTEGAVQWSHTFGDTNRAERSYTLKQFSNGDVAVIGYSLALNGDIHNALIKYSADGTELWDFASENMRYYNDFHIDGSDVCYIMDQSIVDPFPHKIYTAPFPIASLIKVNAEGIGEEEFFPGPAYAEFYGERLIPHEDNRLLLAGSVGNQAFFEGVYFFETEHDGTLSTGKNEVVKNTNWLGQNYPNVVKTTTSIPFHLVNGGKTHISLFNSLGRYIGEIANDIFAAGTNEVKFDASGLAPGIYFYTITSGKFKQSRKMIIAH